MSLDDPDRFRADVMAVFESAARATCDHYIEGCAARDGVDLLPARLCAVEVTELPLAPWRVLEAVGRELRVKS